MLFWYCGSLKSFLRTLSVSLSYILRTIIIKNSNRDESHTIGPIISKSIKMHENLQISKRMKLGDYIELIKAFQKYIFFTISHDFKRAKVMLRK